MKQCTENIPWCCVLAWFGLVWFLISLEFVYSSPIVYNQNETRNLLEQTKSSPCYLKCVQLKSSIWFFLLRSVITAFESWVSVLLYQVLLLSEGISTWHIGNLSYPVSESSFGLVNHKLLHLKTIIVEVLCSLGVGSVLYERKGRRTCLGERRKTFTWHFSFDQYVLKFGC